MIQCLEYQLQAAHRLLIAASSPNNKIYLKNIASDKNANGTDYRFLFQKLHERGAIKYDKHKNFVSEIRKNG